MEKEFFLQLLLSILVIVLIIVNRELIKLCQTQKKDNLNEHLARQALGAFSTIVLIASFLLCLCLTWLQILISVCIAVVLIVLGLRYIETK